MNKFYLLILFLIVKSIYLPLNKRKSKYYWKIKIDDKIPLIPIFIIPYLGYFLYIIFTIVTLWGTSHINSFFISYMIAYVIAGLFWYLFPNGVIRPKITSKDVFSKISKFIYDIDDDTNGFPSAHIFATIICSYFLYINFPQFIFLLLFVSLLITVSTVLTKQHYLVDILGGIFVAYLAIMTTIIWSIH